VEFMSAKSGIEIGFSCRDHCRRSISALIWALGFWPEARVGSVPSKVRARDNLQSLDTMRMSKNLMDET